jgi:1-hydroxycarotenoid 3,4-desaturase
VVVIGAGVGGLACALALAGAGLDVVVVERADVAGGKVRVARVDGEAIDCGPTVLTMRPVFDALFSAAGLELREWLQLHPLPLIARHAWPDGGRLDLFVDEDRSAEAIAELSGRREAEGYRRFTRYGAALLQRLEEPFLHHDNDGLLGLVQRVGLRGLPGLAQLDFRRSMWAALGEFFSDPRLRQLFARYATYYGSSPFAAPATLNLIARVEQRGLWAVEGGMIALVHALVAALEHLGGRVLLGCGVERVEVEGQRVTAAVLEDGTRLACRTAVFNGDPSIVYGGGLGEGVRRAVPPIAAPASLSAVTWSQRAAARGFPLAYHNVFFSDDYAREFTELFDQHRSPQWPTVYLCAQDRLHGTPSGPERIFTLINAAARRESIAPEREATLHGRMLATLRACGLDLLGDEDEAVVSTPASFAERFPGTDGALYGATTHGPMAAFSRHRHRTKVANFWLVGGAVHPGAGLPMVTLGGTWVAREIAGSLRSPYPWPSDETPAPPIRRGVTTHARGR